MTIRLAAACALLCAGLAFSHDPKAGKKIELIGNVVDTACYVGHNSLGAKHASCAETCAKAGNALAILEAKTHTLYLPISMDHKNPNAKLMAFIEKKVKVSGLLLEKGGLKGLLIQNIEAAE